MRLRVGLRLQVQNIVIEMESKRVKVTGIEIESIKVRFVSLTIGVGVVGEKMSEITGSLKKSLTD